MTGHRLGFRARDGLLLSALDHPGAEARTPLLCLPGLTRSVRDFALLAGRHAPRRRVLALDHAGHGDSGRAADPARYRIEESLRDVLDAMAALHCPRAVIVGTSFGGILAMVLGVVRPSAIAGVVLNDIGPELAPGGLGQVRDILARDPAAPDLDALVTWLQGRLPPLTIGPAGWRRLAEGGFRPGEDGRWHPGWDRRLAEVLDRTGPLPPLWGAFGALAHAPLLLLHGELSGLLSAETVRRMRAARPDMAFAEIPGTGHAPTLEEPAAMQAIDGFLEVDRVKFLDRTRIAWWLGTLGGAGRLRPGPGTWGSAVVLPLVWMGPEGCLALSLLLAAAGWWAAGLVVQDATDDPAWFVADEGAGMLLTLAALPHATLTGVALGFALFRAFDILKPWPVSWADSLGGAHGIMLDDLIAGCLAGILLGLMTLLFPGVLG